MASLFACGPPAMAGAFDLRSSRAQMVSIPSFRQEPREERARGCGAPTSLCAPAISALQQGAFLDFRAGTDADRTGPRLLAPFAVTRIDPLDAGRCTAKLCAAHVALSGTIEELLREGYYTHSVALFAGSAVVTLRTERIDRALKPLKGSCRFNLDAACVDPDAWQQPDQRSGEPCGFAQTRVLVASATAPQFVGAAGSAAGSAAPVAGLEALRSVALETASTRLYELLYVHKVCRGEMVLVRNG